MVNYSSRKRFKFLGHEIRTALMIKPWSGIVEGALALTEDGMYALLCDYDALPINIIQYELKAMQARYGFGTTYIIESSPGKYHAFCPDKFSFSEMDEILRQLRIDPGFRQSKMWLLRVSEKKGHKIKLHSILEGNDTLREKSLAHIMLYTKRLNIKIDITNMRVDGYTKTLHTEYSS